MPSALKEFLNDEAGSPTVEFVLWMPVFVMVLALVTNATFVMFEQSKMWDVARDSARKVSLGIMSEVQAEAYIASQFAQPDVYSIDITDPGTSGSTITSEISVHASHLVLFGRTVVGSIFKNGNIKVRVAMTREA